MGGNPFKEIGNAITGVIKGIGAIGLLGKNLLGKKQEQPSAPEPPKPVETVDVDVNGSESKIRKNRRRSSFGGTFVASKNALGAGSGVGGKSFLGQ